MTSFKLETSQTWPERRIEIDDIRVLGSVAVVQYRELGFMGSDGDEVFTLVKSAGGWLIASESRADIKTSSGIERSKRRKSGQKIIRRNTCHPPQKRTGFGAFHIEGEAPYGIDFTEI